MKLGNMEGNSCVGWALPTIAGMVRMVRNAHPTKLVALLLIGAISVCGCRSPQQYRQNADKVADDIIAKKQKEALDKTEPFSIERPSDILRRRLIDEQGLLNAGDASLGTDKLKPIRHWPDNTYPPQTSSPDANVPIEPNEPLRISLIEALQIGAHNSPDYQSHKEDVFRSALDLDLTRNQFRNIFSASGSSQLSRDSTGPQTVTQVASSGTAGISRSFKNGLDVSSTLALNLVHLLTQEGGRTVGLTSDTSVSIPLLRGAGEDIVTEPLTQAERSVIYQMWTFERYKRTFAVSVATSYFSVLRGMDAVTNALADYRSAAQSARWSRRRSDAGRLSEIQVDQATQRELSSRNGWITAQEDLKNRLDSFKNLIGLPTDARIEVDPNDLAQLRSQATKMVEEIKKASQGRAVPDAFVPADAPVELVPASQKGGGPLEMDEATASRLALENRLDLRQAIGAVYDAQRQVVVSADALQAGLTLGGEARFSDNNADKSLHFDGGRYSALLNLDLPIERTQQRNTFRESLISLERATRSVQTLEDQIKLSIRNELRTLLESRESLKIQAQSVVLAEKQVDSSNLLLEAGRIEIRDLLTAQDSLLSAQNSLTAAAVTYRTAELDIQRDLDLLKVNEQGLWQEFSPKEIRDGSQQQQQ